MPIVSYAYFHFLPNFSVITFTSSSSFFFLHLRSSLLFLLPFLPSVFPVPYSSLYLSSHSFLLILLLAVFPLTPFTPISHFTFTLQYVFSPPFPPPTQHFTYTVPLSLHFRNSSYFTSSPFLSPFTENSLNIKHPSFLS